MSGHSDTPGVQIFVIRCLSSHRRMIVDITKGAMCRYFRMFGDCRDISKTFRIVIQREWG